MDKANAVVWITELFLTAWGLWKSIKGARGIWLAFADTHPNGDAYELLWFRVLSLVLVVILPGIALGSAYGLFKRHAWGRIAALIVCVVLLGIGLYTAAALAVMHFQYSGALPEPVPKGAVIVEVNYWPTMISGCFAGILALLLAQNSVKRVFTK